MTKYRWQILIAVLGVIVILLILVIQKAPGVRPATIGSRGIQGGKYTEALVGHLQRLNPLLDSGNQVDRDVDHLIYSGLVGFDSQGRPIPDLAQGWVISKDDLTYTVVLRKGARWQDGTPVTSRDVLFTFGLVQDPNYPGPADLGQMWRQIKIQARDEYTVSFTLPEPYAPFLDFLSQGLLPEHLLAGVKAQELAGQTFNIAPVGTGPFRLDHLITVQNQITGVVLSSSADYYGNKPLLNEVDFLYFSSLDSAFQALRTGQVMGLGGLTPPMVEEALQLPDLQLFTARLPDLSLVLLNLKNNGDPFFGTREVREALLLSLNRERIINLALAGQAFPAASPILPGTWASDPTLSPAPFDPQQAAELLDGAGWQLPTGAAPGTSAYVRANNNKALQFTLVYSDDPLHTRIAQLIQSQWAEIGAKVTLKGVSGSDLLTDYLQPRSYDAALVDFDLSRYPDPDPYPFWHQTQATSGQNYSQLDDSSISEPLEMARTNPDPTTRAQLYVTFQDRFDYEVPALLLWYPTYAYALDTNIKGISLGPLTDPSERLSTLTQWYLATSP
ncbi:MAG: ABC transporter substrate-binding protein [Anaerolineales bacterium]|jgi:peptide/nickel transport system substrate-binding protein